MTPAMSDSFADLWASSAPAKATQTQPPQKLGSDVQPRRPQYDAFSILSASQPSATSKPAGNNQLSNDRKVRHSQPNKNGGDAFSALFASSLDGAAVNRNSDRANMTMAERAALAQKAKATENSAYSAQEKLVSASSSLWDGLDALARPTTASPRPPASAQGGATIQDSFDFGFDNVVDSEAIPYTAPSPGNTLESDAWSLSELTSPSPSGSRSAPVPTNPAPESKHTKLWDLDEFESTEPQTSQPSIHTPSCSSTGTPGHFDFGDREDGLLRDEDSGEEDTFGIRGSNGGHVEDDILGDLGKPVSHSHSPSQDPPTSTRSPARTGVSPPPHITGQLVEMGFSPIDARSALVNTMTDNGFDVQAAAELLLSQPNQEEFIRPSPQSSEPEQRRDRDRHRVSDHAVRRLPTRTEAHNQSQPQLDTTAEKLLSQASEIGRGMFSKANALWREGKERAVKMYEERAAATNAANGAPGLDGKPRWMRDRDQMPNEWQRTEATEDLNATQAGFKDDEEEKNMKEREMEHPPASRPRQTQDPFHSQPPSQAKREREIDLFSADSPVTTYQSPFRRGKPKAQATAPSVQSSPSSTLSTQATIFTTSGQSTSEQPPAPPRAFRTTIPSSTLATSTSYKSAGTDAYRRGDFPVALAAYMRALSALPPGHILRVPILTNIALVRSKVGELRETVKACEEAIVIIRRFSGGENLKGEAEGMSFTGAGSSFDEKTPVEVGTGNVSVSLQGGGGPSNNNLPTSVDLIEGLSKAFRRRAEALEGLEKWETARTTWEVLHNAEWASAGVKGEAIKGVGRCRSMVCHDAGAPSQSAPPKPKPKPNSTRPSRPKPTPSSSVSLPPSAALDALRSAHDAQQTEDAARLACKDVVDSRLTAWKSSREGNIRALLTSLDDTILWPELGWRKIGMAEVVSKGQVKGAYVRAIARVHPDKLNAGNTTVQQRMIANGVFGALNEAWNAFQQQQ